MTRWLSFVFIVFMPWAAQAQVDMPAVDPHRAVTNAEQALSRTLFTGLVTRDGQGQIAPGLAESWTVSADGLSYRFQLRKNAAGPDGKRIDADDVVDSISRALDPSTQAPFYALLLPIKNADAFRLGTLPRGENLGVRATARDVVVFDLSVPSHKFLSVLAEPVAMVMPRMTRFKPQPNALSGLPRPAQDGVRTLYQLLVNVTHPPFNQREVRHALGMVIDRAALIATLQISEAEVSYSVVDAETALQAPYAKLSPADRKAIAEALLLDVQPGQTPPIRVLIPNADIHLTVADALKAAWQPLGFKVDVIVVPSERYEGAVLQGAFDVAWAPGWNAHGGVEPALFLFSQAAGPWNAGHYNEPAFDQFLASADADLNADYRATQWRGAENLLIEDQPAWPLFFYPAMVRQR